MLRVWFRNDRRLLGDLSRIAASVVTDTFRTLLARGKIRLERVKLLLGWRHSGFNNRNFQVYDPLDFLAAATAHIPDP